MKKEWQWRVGLTGCANWTQISKYSAPPKFTYGQSVAIYNWLHLIQGNFYDLTPKN